jgi:Ca2+-binding RTX toxin-like protein
MAQAHIGASHAPIETDAPDLVSVTKGAGALDFCFDEELSVIRPFTFFHATAYNPSAFTTGTSNLSTTPGCILVEFAETNVEGLGVGFIDEGAVEDGSGNTSKAAAASITGSTVDGGLNRTAAPNLISHTVNTSAGSITYIFDTVISCPVLFDAADAGNFGFYNETGQRSTGDSVTGCDGSTIEIDFAGGTDNVDRIIVDTSASTDDVCDGATSTACTHLEAIGTPINVPDLIDATRTGPEEWRFTFDENIDLSDSTQFFIYEDEATRYSATSCAPGTTGIILCGFTDAGIAESTSSEFPIAAVDECAVINIGTTNCNTVGHAAVGTSAEEPGRTSAPDLERITLNRGSDEATFHFDENVDPSSVTASSDFAITNEDGVSTPGVGAADVDDDEVTINFDGAAVDDAVGGQAGNDSSSDFLGNGNLLTSVGVLDTGGDGGGGGGSDPTPSSTPSDSPGPTPSASSSTSPPGTAECSDGIDNDEDGAADADDEECSSDDDDDESGPSPECGNEGVICGSSSDDVIQGTNADETIIGGGGDDECLGGGGDDILFCGAGNDLIRGGVGNDRIWSITGRDIFYGGVGNDRIRGGLGNDTLKGGPGPDNLIGESGFDSIDGGGGNDRCVGGKGDEKTTSCEIQPRQNF